MTELTLVNIGCSLHVLHAKKYYLTRNTENMRRKNDFALRRKSPKRFVVVRFSIILRK